MRPAAAALAVVPALLVLVPAAATAGAGTGRSPVSLGAAPARVIITGSGRATIQVSNSGSRRVEINVRRAGFALDLRGRPRIVRRARVGGPAASWLTVRPRSLVLRPRAKASLTISASVPRRARPGDHNALVVLTTRPIHGARVSVRMRLGVVVVVRAPGRTSRQLELRRLRVRRTRSGPMLELFVANRGNVSEVLQRGRVAIALRRGETVFARLRPLARELLPRTIGIVQARYAGRVRGRTTALVELSDGPGGRVLRRAFRIRL